MNSGYQALFSEFFLERLGTRLTQEQLSNSKSSQQAIQRETLTKVRAPSKFVWYFDDGACYFLFPFPFQMQKQPNSFFCCDVPSRYHQSCRHLKFQHTPHNKVGGCYCTSTFIITVLPLASGSFLWATISWPPSCSHYSSSCTANHTKAAHQGT